MGISSLSRLVVALDLLKAVFERSLKLLKLPAKNASVNNNVFYCRFHASHVQENLPQSD